MKCYRIKLNSSPKILAEALLRKGGMMAGEIAAAVGIEDVMNKQNKCNSCGK